MLDSRELNDEKRSCSRKGISALITFGWLTFWNSWQFMDFASVSALGKQIFHCDDQGLNWLYSASLVAVVVSSIPAIYLLEQHGATGNWSVMAIGTVANVCGGWLRWFSVAQESYAVALLSSIFLGFAGAAVIVSIVPLAEHNFPKETRTLATTVAVQLNYLGWCLSSVVVPANSGTKTELGSMLYTQAILISISLVLFPLFHQPRPQCMCCGTPAPKDNMNESSNLLHSDNAVVATNALPQSNNAVGLSHHVGQMVALCRNRAFLVQCVCFAALGGISFAIPAVQDELFLELGLSQDMTKWTNLCFLATGVTTGLTIGTIFHQKNIQPTDFYSMFTIRLLFGLCTVSLSGLAVLASFASELSNSVVFSIASVLMCISGGCSLGFVGIALPQAVSVARPVSEVYSASAVEWMLQIFGVVFAQWCAGAGGSPSPSNSTILSPSSSSSLESTLTSHSNGFVICAASCAAATFGLLFFSTENKLLE